MRQLHILIIGSGPTGLTAALELARNGVHPTIVEKRPGASTLSRAAGVMPFCRKRLTEKAADEILEQGMPFMKMNMHVGEERILQTDANGLLTEDDVIVGLPQDRTERILRDELSRKGVEIQFDTEVTFIENRAENAVVRFNNEEELHSFDWIIACDGIRSMVRQSLGIAYPGYDLEGRWSIADIEVEELTKPWNANNIWMMLGENNDSLVSLPIGKKRIRLISSNEDCMSLLPLPLKVKHVNRQGTFGISVRQAETYRKGRILLAGDAAHCQSPVGGKGMNLGIDDAIAAVQCILSNSVDLYSPERHQVGQKIIQRTERMRKIITSDSAWTKRAMAVLMRLVAQSSWLQKRVMLRACEL